MVITNKPDTGIECNVKSNYKIFGKFIVNMNLLCDGILLVKYTRSHAMVPSIKRTKVSKQFKIFLFDLLDKNKIDYTLLKACTQNDKAIFDNLIVRANVHRQLDYDKLNVTKEDETELKLKFQILQGEMIAGNNSEEIIHELKYVINELVQLKVISLKDSEELIAELPI